MSASTNRPHSGYVSTRSPPTPTGLLPRTGGSATGRRRRPEGTARHRHAGGEVLPSGLPLRPRTGTAARQGGSHQAAGSTAWRDGRAKFPRVRAPPTALDRDRTDATVRRCPCGRHDHVFARARERDRPSLRALAGSTARCTADTVLRQRPAAFSSAASSSSRWSSSRCRCGTRASAAGQPERDLVGVAGAGDVERLPVQRDRQRVQPVEPGAVPVHQLARAGNVGDHQVERRAHAAGQLQRRPQRPAG